MCNTTLEILAVICSSEYYISIIMWDTALLALTWKKNIRNTGGTTIKIKRRTDINQDIFIPQGWMISAQTTQLDLQQTFNGRPYLVVG